MKKFITSLLSCFAVVLLMVPIAHAQTPDAQTPANEGVCDVLADGATKGLYGLCIAFCEAQDHTSLDAPITGDDLEAMMDIKPAGKILANYNKKKTDNDPPMPCIKEAPCPCWTAEELASIDFTMFDGAPAHAEGGRYCDDKHYPQNNYTRTQTTLSELAENINAPRGVMYTTARVDYFTDLDENGEVIGVFGTCHYENGYNNTEGTLSRIGLWLLPHGGDLTTQQLEYCHSSLHGQLENIRASCTTGNQAPGQ